MRTKGRVEVSPTFILIPKSFIKELNVIGMNIYINDDIKQIGEDDTLQSVIDHVDIKRKKGIAVAVDNQVIPRNQWEHYYLKENAKVVIITATQGG